MKILTPLLRLVARLPLRVLYPVATASAWGLEHVVRYRRRVIRGNLERCFPEKSQAELRQIEHDFYGHFADYIVETLKLLHISDAEMSRRMRFTNLAIIDNHLKAGRSVAVYFSHSFNWEWAPAVTLHSSLSPSETIKFAQIYRPLKSKEFDAIMLSLRHRFNSVSISKHDTARTLLDWRRRGVVSVTGFMSDQHPGWGDGGEPVMFFNQPTMMISGTETLARKLNMAVVFWDMNFESRGHYTIDVKEIAADASAAPPGVITETYAKMLEDSIRRNPSLWLWSHKRWKHPLTPEQIQTAHDNAK